MDHNTTSSTTGTSSSSKLTTATAVRHQRLLLDRLYATDSIISITLGILSLVTPHVVLVQLTGNGSYNHSVHETVRLYACLRIAFGYMLWHVRTIDDGLFRRHLCEALFVCYFVQAGVVVRAQFTGGPFVFMNWMAIVILTTLSIAYGSFRFRNGGNLIKVYELPSSAVHQ